ncbi:MAG: hypothetical protein KC503_16175 [Myxococcales bacterium]|nr:hypothetical protein [Myxococcales bacterium]
MADKKPSRNIDIWLVMVIILVVSAIGGGLWMASKGIHARLDHLAIRTTSKMTQVRTEMFGLGNQVQSLTMEVRKLRKQITAMQSAAAAAAADKKR